MSGKSAWVKSQEDTGLITVIEMSGVWLFNHYFFFFEKMQDLDSGLSSIMALIYFS